MMKHVNHLAANSPQRIIILGRQTGDVVDGGSDCGVICESGAWVLCYSVPRLGGKALSE
jgi:hypothetical protein